MAKTSASPDRERWPVYRFGVSMGLCSLRRKHWSIGAKQLLMPVQYWRFYPFSMAVQMAKNLREGSRILDIESPKLLSLYLAAKLGMTVHATDIQDKAIFNRYQTHFEDYCALKKVAGHYSTELQDARNLRYPDNHFDFIYSISVIEHIPDDGDALAMKEIARTLKPGGVTLIEVPYAAQHSDTYVARDVYERRHSSDEVFYQRHYDHSSLIERLVEPSTLSLTGQVYFRERLPFERFWEKIPDAIKAPLLWTEAFIPKANLESSKRAPLPDSKVAMDANLILRKEIE